MNYRVKALSLGGLGNKIFKSKDIVNDSNFPPGNAEQLVNSGHLVAIDNELNEEISEFEKLITEVKETKESKIVDYKEITTKELKAILDMEDSKLSKKELYKLYKELD